MSKATKWRKVGNEWRRGPLRVLTGPSAGWYWYGIRLMGWTAFISRFPTPEAAMRAADRWAARMLKALRKLEGK